MPVHCRNRFQPRVERGWAIQSPSLQTGFMQPSDLLQQECPNDSPVVVCYFSRSNWDGAQSPNAWPGFSSPEGGFTDIVCHSIIILGFTTRECYLKAMISHLFSSFLVEQSCVAFHTHHGPSKNRTCPLNKVQFSCCSHAMCGRKITGIFNFPLWQANHKNQSYLYPAYPRNLSMTLFSSGGFEVNCRWITHIPRCFSCHRVIYMLVHKRVGKTSPCYSVRAILPLFGELFEKNIIHKFSFSLLLSWCPKVTKVIIKLDNAIHTFDITIVPCSPS